MCVCAGDVPGPRVVARGGRRQLGRRRRRGQYGARYTTLNTDTLGSILESISYFWGTHAVRVELLVIGKARVLCTIIWKTSYHQSYGFDNLIVYL